MAQRVRSTRAYLCIELYYQRYSHHFHSSEGLACSFLPSDRLVTCHSPLTVTHCAGAPLGNVRVCQWPALCCLSSRRGFSPAVRRASQQVVRSRATAPPTRMATPAPGPPATGTAHRATPRRDAPTTTCQLPRATEHGVPGAGYTWSSASRNSPVAAEVGNRAGGIRKYAYRIFCRAMRYDCGHYLRRAASLAARETNTS